MELEPSRLLEPKKTSASAHFYLLKLRVFKKLRLGGQDFRFLHPRLRFWSPQSRFWRPKAASVNFDVDFWRGGMAEAYSEARIERVQLEYGKVPYAGHP